MKLLAALLCVAVTCGAVSLAVSRRPRPPPPLTALELCSTGGVELIDERCNSAGACASQSVRLTWNRGEGALFEGDVSGERELRRIRGAELEQLLVRLPAVTPASSDSDLVCGSFGCPATERAMTITTSCGAISPQTFTFMRGRPAWERVRSECVLREGTELAKCAAQRAWHAAFATTLASRFSTVFDHLRRSARDG